MSDQFLAENLSLGYLFENKTQKEKRKMVSGQSEQNTFKKKNKNKTPGKKRLSELCRKNSSFALLYLCLELIQEIRIRLPLRKV